jgi:hypothetical protein
LVAFLGVRFVAGFVLSKPLSLAAGRLRGLLICVVLNLIITTFGLLLFLSSSSSSSLSSA